MKNDINHYWVEGDCEKAFVRSSPLIGIPEKVDLTELTNDQVRKRTIKLSGNKKKLWINIVFDTDVMKKDPMKLNCFLLNIEYLLNLGFQIRLLQQQDDFEEEIMKCNGLSLSQFKSTFNIKNITEFKKNMLNEHSMHKKLCAKIPNFALWESNLFLGIGIHTTRQSSYSKQPKK